jgi:hypothetical protein
MYVYSVRSGRFAPSAYSVNVQHITLRVMMRLLRDRLANRRFSDHPAVMDYSRPVSSAEAPKRDRDGTRIRVTTIILPRHVQTLERIAKERGVTRCNMTTVILEEYLERVAAEG